LFGNFGEHVGSYQIVMPEAGRLVADSGKMTVLDPLLRRLRSEGHKCLIYSQFTKVLDILEDYCGKSAYKFVRLDGQSALADRRDIVAEWQANEELFIFLLSTRAGGVGLNLTAADTVIFFDSDWNPTQDLQAMDRAHRLGQERPVTVYRLTSRGTIEERMLIRAQQKSKINDLVIKGGGIQTDMEEPGEAEIDDIAALLIGEDTDDSKLDMDSAVDLAKRAADSITSAPEAPRGSETSWERAKKERLVDKCLVLKPAAKVDHLLHCVLSSRRRN
jgi:chromatin-remodeling ATPase INO80